MIYRVEIDDFISVFKKLQELGSFCTDGKNIFIATNEEISDVEFIKNPLEINVSNYKLYTNNNTAKWCLKVLNEEELHRYEQSEECQAKLEEVNNFIDNIEKRREAIRVGKEKTEQPTNNQPSSEPT